MGRRWWTQIVDRAHRIAIAAATRPYASTGAILALNASLALLFVPAGQLLFSDPAEFFRELMPGTWLSFAELLFIAAIAGAIHRAVFGSRRRRLDNFWGLSVIVFILLAIEEITQFTTLLSSALTSLDTVAPLGFKDLQAFLLSVLILALAAGLLRYARDLFAHPAAMGLLAIGVLLGAGSQFLDSAFASTSGEFVAEESLKLAAEPFLIGGYLLVLHRFLGRDPGYEPANPRGSQV